MKLISPFSPPFRFLWIVLSGILLQSAVFADTRSSTDYALTTEVTGLPGAASFSADYALSSETPHSGGIATASAPVTTQRTGFAGQLYDPASLLLAADPATVNEGETRQITPSLQMDDDSLIVLDPNSVTWSVESGPLASISPAGLATAATVYQSTLAVAKGIHSSFEDELMLTVLNTGTDDFGTYAGDGIDDDWQVQYFGENNPLAAPGQNPDSDPHDNRFEFTAGLDPTDINSRFTVTLADDPGNPGAKQIQIHPIVAGRAYTVMFADDLAPPVPWMFLMGTFEDDGDTRTFLDNGPFYNSYRFYQVEIIRNP